MADFISQLSGPEMDNALQEVNAHNAEAWSSGTRGGVQVASGDPTYDNNAKYWAGVAKSAVPAGTAAAVLWNQEQQLTDAQKAQARKNISAGGSNQNLLDNPWFTVNQRNFSGSAPNNVYTVDRWKSGGVGSGNVIIVNTGSVASQGNDVYLRQDFGTPILKNLVGKSMTFSALLSSGDFYSKTFNVEDNVYRVINGTVRFDYDTRTTSNFVLFMPEGNTVKAVKLELGSVSTLANDVAPNYVEELNKCMASTTDSSDDFANKPTHPYAISTHKSTQRAWPGNTFIFNNVEPDNGSVYEFIARVSTLNGFMIHMYLTIRSSEANTVCYENVGISQGSATYDTATKTLTITTTQSSYWIYSLHRIATFV